ncbi:cytochrome c oxidase assembly protein subunit 16 [Geosmithia morbida]|uniref:Cytochrome c oxidase assembly protein COX16, mitochondrial n=1 Tax=Geosmithia morbida TaxID=1094350 RepID=A0A9P5D3T9_9HYPO|nr:cytochrome c oxidase assembly protein subunit 16 [Geosmithia morbida]KAF4122851.1 cytochrome c oxidase assembly protein subunit 16 [Geosmithia morbida]
MGFQNKKFRSAGDMNKAGMRYRALMNKHPFITFGLPFLGIIIAGSFVLTPATAIRYEKHDRKVRQMTREEELGVRRGAGARKVDMRDEYYRLAGRDIENWEQKRVERLPGESDGILR